jgi:ELWxxDGT repeat protein
MRFFNRTSLLVGLCLLTTVTFSLPGRGDETPHRLADFAAAPLLLQPSDTLPEEPADFFSLGNRLLFSTVGVNDKDGGILWSTDGTAAGTVQISSSLCPFPCQQIVPVAVGNGIAVLKIVVDRGASLFRLARTDGTPAGTYLLSDSFDPGAEPVFAQPDFFFFGHCSEPGVCQLWASDGTAAGTRPVPAANGLTFSVFHGFTPWNGRLCFSGLQSDGAQSLWCSDGTTAGTIPLAPLVEPDDEVSRLAATPSHLFFTSGVSGQAGQELWVSDGVPGSARQLTGFPIDVDSLAADPDADAVIFATHRDGHGTEIWRSDGTAAGTVSLLEMPPGLLISQLPRHLGSRWVFAAGADGQASALWGADAGFAHAAPLAACSGGECPSVQLFLSPSTTTVPQLFAGTDPAHGTEPWATDGTAAGTRRLADVAPGAGSGLRLSSGLTPLLVPAPDGRTWFRAYPDPAAPDETGDALWVTDGTLAGTHRVAGHFAGVGFLAGRAYFGTGLLNRPASDLWSTDGSPNGARRVAVLRRFSLGSDPRFQPFQNGVLMFPLDTEGGYQLWRSDGDPAGTVLLADFPPASGRTHPAFFPAVGALQLFSLVRVSGGSAQYEIWRTDGTVRGTRKVAALTPQDGLGVATAWDGKLLFAVGTADGCSLWTSDGTQTGTRPLLPLPAIGGLSCPTAIADLGSRFLYVVEVLAHRRLIPQVFVSDGTLAGTRQITAFDSPAAPLFDDHPVRIGRTVYFRLVSPHDPAVIDLWQSDGTAAGTRRVGDWEGAAELYAFRGSLYYTAWFGEGRALVRVTPGGGPAIVLGMISHSFDFPQFPDVPSFAPAGDRLLFAGSDPAHGSELWITDGTAAGTRRLRDIQPGAGGSAPQGFVSAGGRVFFAADDGAHGRELWESDGTVEGTRQVADIAPGGFSALVEDPFRPVVANGFLFFNADDGKTGLEPWALRLAP